MIGIKSIKANSRLTKRNMDYIGEYEKLKAQGFPFNESLDFSLAIGRSEDIETHFKLYCLEMERPAEERKLHLSATFAEHGRAGGEYLLSLLCGDETAASHAVFLLASDRFRSAYGLSPDEKTMIRREAVQLTESSDPIVRRRSIIVIGWIGTAEEIPLLNRHLLTDEDVLCRAWSASSFLQMTPLTPGEREALQINTKDSLIECLKTEQDVYVKGTAVEAIMEVWDVSFGLRSSAVEDRNQKAVDRAAKKALLFLEQGKR